MITVIREPNLEVVNPVENCIDFSLLTDEYIVAEGVNAMMIFRFNATSTQEDGDSIIINGQTFTVDGSLTESTSTSYNGTSANPQTNSIAFAEMLRLNIAFCEYSIETSQIGGFFVVILEANCFGLQDIWETEQAGLSGVIYTTISNGSNIELKNGYKLLYKLFKEDRTPVCRLEGVVPPLRNCSNLQLPVVVDFQHELSSLVETTIPELTQTAVINDPTIQADFYLKYGSRYIVGDCNMEYGDFKKSNLFRVINSAIQANDEDGMRIHHANGGGRGGIDFLTCRPVKSCVCPETYMWNWLLFDLDDFFENSRPSVLFIAYSLNVEFYDSGILVGSSTQLLSQNSDGAYIFPIGPANMMDGIVTPANGYDEYRYKVIASITFDTIPFPVSTTINYSIQRTVKVGNCCTSDYQIAFLCSKGGYDTLTCLKKIEHSADTAMTEICKDAPCGGEFSERGLYGKTEVNSTTYEKITLETELNPNNEDWRNFLLDFKASENRFLIDKDKNGEDWRRRVVLEAGSTKIFEYEKKIKIQFTLVYSQNYKHQSN